MYGEYFLESQSRAMATGSPPHVWGILDNVCLNTINHRSTPTCVGKANAGMDVGIYF